MQEFAHAGRDVLEKFSLPRAVNESHAKRRAEWDPLRRNVLAPTLNKASDALKAEFEASRYIIPYRVVIKKNEGGAR